MSNIAAIILAAGRGTRMNSTDTNKVMSIIHNQPLLGYTIENLSKTGITEKIIVVGFAKESIQNTYSANQGIKYAIQEEINGTAKALECGLAKVSEKVIDVLSVYGDDSYLYEPTLLKQLIERHQNSDSDVTLLTVKKENPTGLGRIVRDQAGNFVKIVEEKVATEEEKKVKEINTGCFIFDKKFITEYISKIEKNPTSQEYYLTDIIEIARKNNKKIETYLGNEKYWHGVNTPEELEEANKKPTRYIN